jgi:DNA-binding transcriptional ArsR family regulator
MDIFQILAEPRRREIIKLIAGRGLLSATDIADNFEVTASAISQHLQILLDANILFLNKQAQTRLYTLNPDFALELELWLKDIAYT